MKVRYEYNLWKTNKTIRKIKYLNKYFITLLIPIFVQKYKVGLPIFLVSIES